MGPDTSLMKLFPMAAGIELFKMCALISDGAQSVYVIVLDRCLALNLPEKRARRNQLSRVQILHKHSCKEALRLFIVASILFPYGSAFFMQAQARAFRCTAILRRFEGHLQTFFLFIWQCPN